VSGTAENKTTTTAKKLVEKTKDLAQKIAEAKVLKREEKEALLARHTTER